MKQFERFNKLTEVKETYISCPGVITTMATESTPNKGSNGKSFFKFGAKIDIPSGIAIVGGQIYEDLVPYLHGLPKVGDRLELISKKADLEEGFNSRWGIGGACYDDTDSILADINAL